MNESILMMPHQTQNINSIEIIKSKQVETQQFKSTITEKKNLLEELNSGFMQSEERISELREKSVKILKYGKQGVKKKKNEEK